MNHSTPGLPVHQQLSWSPPKPMSIESVMHPTISSSVVPFSSCPQSFPASGSFQMSQLSLSIYMLISGLSILSHGSMCIYFVLIPYHLEYYYYCSIFWNQGGLPWWLRWWRICLKCRRPGFNPWVGEIPWRRKWQPTPVFLLLDHAEWKWWEWSRLVRYKLNWLSSPCSLPISLRLPGGTGLVHGYTWLKESTGPLFFYSPVLGTVLWTVYLLWPSVHLELS